VTGVQTCALPISGWPFWHGVLALIGLVLLFGPRQAGAHAATALAALLIAVVPMMLAGGFADFGGREIVLLITAVLVPPVYLSWWLRDELRSVYELIQRRA